MLKVRRAQIISEYALVISLIVVIMVTMFTLVKRSTQKMTQLAADRIGNQINADQDFASNRGYMISSATDVDMRTIRTKYHVPGSKGDAYSDLIRTATYTYSNQGFTSDQQDIVTNSTVDMITLPLP